MGIKRIINAIGEPTEATTVRGRQNVPAGENFAWWTCKMEYRHNLTNELYSLEELQCKYELGFAEKRLWNIIEREYTIGEIYVMNVNHPRYEKVS